MDELPEYLRRLGVHPRKALGQHFLIDEFALADIAAACELRTGEVALEIGAGPGGLTEELLQVAEHVVAVELDEELAALTRTRLSDAGQLTVLAADVLDFTPEELLEEAGASPPYVAVGNLPYYIAQPVVRRLLESVHPPRRVVIMVQREVARRMIGGAGQESLLSISVQCYGSARLILDVPSASFWPVPAVQSAVVAIDAHEEARVPPGDGRAQFFHVVRAGFSMPRKQLHNALPGALGLSGADVTETLLRTNIDPAARAQHLQFADWLRLRDALRERYPHALDLPVGQPG